MELIRGITEQVLSSLVAVVLCFSFLFHYSCSCAQLFETALVHEFFFSIAILNGSCFFCSVKTLKYPENGLPLN